MVNEYNKRIIRKEIECFKNNILIELEQAHDRWFDDFGFQIFGESSKDYFELVYFQSYLEFYARKMINGILKSLIDMNLLDEYRWPEFEYNGVCSGYTNIEYEREFKFEFVNQTKRIGYKYTISKDCDIAALLNCEGVESIKIISWNNGAGLCFVDDPLEFITPKDFFNKVFSDAGMEMMDIEDLYDFFFCSVNQSITEARGLISLNTIPGFSYRYRSKNREEVLRVFEQKVSSLERFIVNDKDYKSTQKKSKCLVTKARLMEYFLNNSYQLAFVGDNDYAKSFMTSEYLYKYFKSNPIFDYSSVLSGYIKSIEQLLCAICNKHDLNGQNNGKETLGTYIKYLKNHKDIFRKELDDDDVNTIICCLYSYLNDTRNKIFHKVLFSNWKQVEKVRDNTFFLYAIILGSIENSFLKSNPCILNPLDTKYNEFFDLLDGYNGNYFDFILDGKEYIDMLKLIRTEGISYDADGIITNNIAFKKNTCDVSEELVIEFNKKQLPAVVWLSSQLSNDRKQIWPFVPNNNE